MHSKQTGKQIITLKSLIEEYPIPSDYRQHPGCLGNRLTGMIPIEQYLYQEKEITAARKAVGKVRVIYRGPRWFRYEQDTRRNDATGVVLYKRK